jgi:hypothetical protein
VVETARGIVAKSQESQRVSQLTERKRREFEMGWVQDYQNFIQVLPDSEKKQLIDFCTGGYQFFSLEQQERNLSSCKNFYTILSTFQPFSGKQNIMPLLSQKIKD